MKDLGTYFCGGLLVVAKRFRIAMHVQKLKPKLGWNQQEGCFLKASLHSTFLCGNLKTSPKPEVLDVNPKTGKFSQMAAEEILGGFMHEII